MRLTVVVAALCAAAWLVGTGEAGFVATVPSHGTECFREEVNKGDSVKVMFQVLEGGNLDVDYEIINPAGGVVSQGEEQSDGKYDFRAEMTGLYKICFSNRVSTAEEKLVSVALYVGQAKNFLGKDEMTSTEASVNSLSQAVEDIREDQEYFLMRDIAHKAINDSTSRRVLYWFMFQFLLILSLAAWQVFYVRRFFEVKRPV